MNNDIEIVPDFLPKSDELFFKEKITYIFAKIGKGNSLAEKYLNGKSEVTYPAIPIYFDCDHDNENDFLRSGSAKNQGILFFQSGKSIEKTFIIVVYDGKVSISRPVGNVVFKKSIIRPEDNGYTHYVKLLPIEILKEVPLSDTPHVLASIGANRYYSSGTFREITSSGNLLAIQAILGLTVQTPKEPGLIHALECLSSVELETLIAKLFEEAGLFVPAYRGGTMADVDLFAQNRTSTEIILGSLRIKPTSRISIQVKLCTSLKVPPDGVDYLVACNIPDSPRALGSDWLSFAIASCPKTRGWLETSLDWLPSAFLEKTIGRAVRQTNKA